MCGAALVGGITINFGFIRWISNANCNIIGYHRVSLADVLSISPSWEWMAKGWWLIQWPIYIILVVDKTKLSCLEAWCRGKEDRVGGKGARGQSKVMGINYITVVKLGLNAKVCMNLHVTLLHMSEGNFRS